ncbi:MAG TPA: hypothetical protein ENI81_08790, partial [Phycisphaerales bacterium]|nr:hypothetical protein [Phycisphaerales bacterium]
MRRAELLNGIEIQAGFTDVLYLTDQHALPAEIKRLFKQKKLSFRVLPVEKFGQVRDRLDLIGTVVVDARDSADSEQQLARIIERLDMENIGVILLTGLMRVPVRSFSLSPTKTSFCLSSTTEGISTDELWARISVNLACRKGNSSTAVKPVLPSRPVHTIFKNKLAEQLNMTKTLAESLTEQLRLAGLVQQDFLPAKLPNTDETQ